MSFTGFDSGKKNDPPFLFSYIVTSKVLSNSAFWWFFAVKSENVCPFQDFQGPQPKFKDFPGPWIFFCLFQGFQGPWQACKEFQIFQVVYEP